NSGPWGARVLNNGTISISGVTSATGVYQNGLSPYADPTQDDLQNGATGTFSVTASAGQATGASMGIYGVFENDGTFTVSGSNGAVGVDMFNAYVHTYQDQNDVSQPGKGSFHNTGNLTVTSSGGSAVALSWSSETLQGT